MTHEPAFRTARLADLERSDGWVTLRQHFDVQAFGINAWTAHEAGGQLIGEHDEVTSGHEEIYLVIAGAATFTVADEDLEAPAGTVIYIRNPTVRRAAAARDPETTVLAVGGTPGKAFKPMAWETNADVIPLFESGDFAGVKRIMNEALDRYQDRAHLLFNLACAEARLGESDAAIEHLSEALDERPGLAELAKKDPDFDPIRDDPRFATLFS
jgi:mannose-6-phosphate isomerase-like protein (cupin superfamily)